MKKRKQITPEELDEILDNLDDVEEAVYCHVDSMNSIEEDNVKWGDKEHYSHLVWLKGIPWKGHEVIYYEFEGDGPIIGLPYVIFIKDNKARLSTVEEARDYLDYQIRNN